MGNCHFKSEFEQESVAGKKRSITLKREHVHSSDEDELQLLILHWKRRLWQGVEGGKEKDQAALRHEGNVQGAHHHQEKHKVGHERTTDPHTASQSFHRQYVLRVPRP